MHNIMNQIQEATPVTRAGAKSKVVRVLATIVSYIFHPVFIPSLMAMVLYQLDTVSFAGFTDHEFGKWLAIIIINTMVYPVLTIFLLKALGFIKSIHLHEAKDRIIPLMGAMVFYFWANNVFKNITSPFILKVLLLGSFWGIIVIFIINIFYKVSMHAAAAGSMVGVLIVLMLISPVNMIIPLLISIVVAGIIGTARMALGAHQGGQVWLGYAVGILVQIGAFFYLK
jgi:hypothetical protein